MSKPFINYCAILGLMLGLTACGSTPSTPTGASPASASKPVEVNPQVAAQYQRAVTLLKQGQHNQALAEFKAVSEKAPQLAGAYINIGLIHLQQRRYTEAEQALQQATQVKPDDAIAFNHLGVALREQGKFDKAEQAYQQALRLNSSYADAHLNTGILFDIYLNDLGRALSHYERYQSLTNNKNEQVNKWIADIKLRQSQQKGK